MLEKSNQGLTQISVSSELLHPQPSFQIFSSSKIAGFTGLSLRYKSRLHGGGL